MNEPWNICDDFLDPLGELLWQYQQDEADKQALALAVFRLYDKASMAVLWCRVNASDGVAKELHGALRDIRTGIIENNEWLACGLAWTFLDDLSAVLRSTAKSRTILPPPPRDDGFAGPFKASELYGTKGKVAGSKSTFYRMKEKMPGLFQKVQNGYRISRQLLGE